MKSLWIETTKDNINLKPLQQDEETEICVIGAGLFGLTTAYYLTKQGKKVVVIEKGDIGEKVSGNTTGKITSQHDLFYYHLIQDYGEEYVYTTQEDEVIEIEKEVQAVNKLGKNAKFVTQTELPFKIKGAIEFQNQAQFHPRKYMVGLCKKILEKNKIYTFTTALDLEKDEDNYIIYTDKGNIKAKYVVLATHYPIINAPGFYFTKMYQSTSYLIAIETNSKIPQGMYINVKEPIYSFRSANYNGKEVLLIGGSGHKTGEPIENNYHYEELEKKAKELYPDCKVIFKWNTRDCIGLDKIPYIGEFSNMMKNLYVGTGFKKWGMTLSNVAANIVTDKILEKENKFEDIFNATRMKPIKNRWEVKNMLKETVNSIALNKFKIEPAEISKIENDNGAIIEIPSPALGIYKDSKGEIYAIKPNCSHLGCLLSWNNLDKTWDCPCHGSRFDFKGNNIYEPAIKNLDVKNLQKKV